MIADLLAGEIIDRQPDDVHDLMLCSSIVDDFDADLCDLLTGRNDSRSRLEGLERETHFVVTVDEKRPTYRYHHLLRDLLRAQPEYPYRFRGSEVPDSGRTRRGRSSSRRRPATSTVSSRRRSRRLRPGPSKQGARSSWSCETRNSDTGFTTWVECKSGSVRSGSRPTSLSSITHGRGACSGPCSRPMRCSASPRRGFGGRGASAPSAVPRQLLPGWLAALEQIAIDGACSRRESSTRISPERNRRPAATCGRACLSER